MQSVHQAKPPLPLSPPLWSVMERDIKRGWKRAGHTPRFIFLLFLVCLFFLLRIFSSVCQTHTSFYFSSVFLFSFFVSYFFPCLSDTHLVLFFFCFLFVFLFLIFYSVCQTHTSFYSFLCIFQVPDPNLLCMETFSFSSNFLFSWELLTSPSPSSTPFLFYTICILEDNVNFTM